MHKLQYHVSFLPLAWNLLLRAGSLGDHAVLHNKCVSNLVFLKVVKYEDIDPDKLHQLLSCREPPLVTDDIEESAIYLCNAMHSLSVGCVIVPLQLTGVRKDGNAYSNPKTRDAQVWRAVNWRGEVDLMPSYINTMPTDGEFKHFEEILNPSGVNESIEDALRTATYMPVLDNPFTVQEVSQQIARLKSSRASGPEGLLPGVFKALPVPWLISLTTLFNCVFSSGSYPSSWATAKLFSIFKRGSRALVSNYRGMSIINSLAKLYDMIICHRCVEHIVALRLFIEFAKKKRLKLFVTFVDFSKASDKVRREVLFSDLRRLGCGVAMILAIFSMYNVTKCIVHC